MKTIAPTEVTITGGTAHGSRLVTSLIATALSGSGFSNINVSNAQTGQPVDLSESPATILDLVRATNPALFSEPVTVWQHAPEEEAEESPSAETPAPTGDSPDTGSDTEEATHDPVQ